VAIDEALARSERNDERWYLAESLRVKGELLLRQGGPDGPREAERYFLESFDCARRQNTPAWELRTSISLGILWRNQNRLDDARKLVGSSYAGFAEGSKTTDLQAARQLLEELGG
jgi:predicted ATPase